LCYTAVSIRPRLGYDDSLDVVGVHGAGGTWGALATGLFATTAVNSAGKNGLFYGDASLLMKQAIAVLATYVFVFAASCVLLKVVDLIIGLRVSEEDEHTGLDLAVHGESGYDFE
jgi:Amt family ammonium transporter